MALDSRKKQQKVERRNAKERARRKHALQRNCPNTAVALTRAATSPVYRCFATEALWTVGMGVLVVSRHAGGQNVAFATFLIDAKCLGVKDAAYGVKPIAEFDMMVAEKVIRDKAITELSIEQSRRLHDDAVAYARTCGIAPHDDDFRAQRIFGETKPAAEAVDVEFGRNGRPTFIPGPYDSPARCQEILFSLRATHGPGNFEFVLMNAQLQQLVGGGTLSYIEASDDEFGEFDDDEFEEE